MLKSHLKICISLIINEIAHISKLISVLSNCFSIFSTTFVFLSLPCKRSVNIDILLFGLGVCHLTFNSAHSGY